MYVSKLWRIRDKLDIIVATIEYDWFISIRVYEHPDYRDKYETEAIDTEHYQYNLIVARNIYIIALSKDTAIISACVSFFANTNSSISISFSIAWG